MFKYYTYSVCRTWPAWWRPTPCLPIFAVHHCARKEESSHLNCIATLWCAYTQSLPILIPSGSLQLVAHQRKPRDHHLCASIFLTIMYFISASWLSLFCSIPAIVYSLKVCNTLHTTWSTCMHTSALLPHASLIMAECHIYNQTISVLMLHFAFIFFALQARAAEARHDKASTIKYHRRSFVCNLCSLLGGAGSVLLASGICAFLLSLSHNK